MRQLLGAGLVLATGTVLAQAAPNLSATSSSTVTLPQVTVQESNNGALQKPAAGGQLAHGGSLGLLGTTDAMNVPFSTTNYTSQLLEDQQTRTLADVVINDASVRTSTGSNGFDDTFVIRGFAVPAGDVGFNGLYGLVSSSRAPAQIIERVEVLKGPGALINGIAPGGSVGGGINVVTKRASDIPLTRITTTYTSKSNFAAAFDVGRRFGEDNAWGIRINGLVRDGEASIRDGNQATTLGSLGLDYQSRKLRWSLDLITQHDDTDNFRPQISLLSTATAIPAVPDARSNWYPGTGLVQKDETVATRVEYDFTDSITGYAGIGYRDGTNNQTFPSSSTAVNAAGNFTLRNGYYDSYTKTTSGNAGVRFKFDTAGIGHQLVLGVTGFKQEAGNFYAQSPAPGVASNIYNPSALPAVLIPRGAPTHASDADLTSFAIADTLSFMNDRVLLTLGARDQKVVQTSFSQTTGAQTSKYDASALSPLAGIVIKPVDNVSVYGNYTEGLSRGTIVGATYANAGAVLDPYKSKQLETGVKIDWGKFTTTASIFQIERPAAQANGSNVYGYFGEQRNRGLELTAFGEIQRGLRGMASLALTDPKLTSTAGGVNQGNDAAGIPDTTFSGSLDWDAPWQPGLGFNGRVIYTSGSYLTAANTQKFDGWTRYDIGARYKTTIANKAVVFRANIENLFNKNYWLTTGTYVTVGAPRTAVLSASVDF